MSCQTGLSCAAFKHIHTHSPQPDGTVCLLGYKKKPRERLRKSTGTVKGKFSVEMPKKTSTNLHLHTGRPELVRARLECTGLE